MRIVCGAPPSTAVEIVLDALAEPAERVGDVRGRGSGWRRWPPPSRAMITQRGGQEPAPRAASGCGRASRNGGGRAPSGRIAAAGPAVALGGDHERLASASVGASLVLLLVLLRLVLRPRLLVLEVLGVHSSVSARVASSSSSSSSSSVVLVPSSSSSSAPPRRGRRGSRRRARTRPSRRSPCSSRPRPSAASRLLAGPCPCSAPSRSAPSREVVDEALERLAVAAQRGTETHSSGPWWPSPIGPNSTAGTPTRRKETASEAPSRPTLITRSGWCGEAASQSAQHEGGLRLDHRGRAAEGREQLGVGQAARPARGSHRDPGRAGSERRRLLRRCRALC